MKEINLDKNWIMKRPGYLWYLEHKKCGLWQSFKHWVYGSKQRIFSYTFFDMIYQLKPIKPVGEICESCHSTAPLHVITKFRFIEGSL